MQPELSCGQSRTNLLLCSNLCVSSNNLCPRRLLDRSLWSPSQRRQFLTVFPNQPWEFQSAGQSWDKNLRLRNQSPEPSEIESVRPIGNRSLVASDKPKRSAYAMDRRPIRQIFAQIKTELFLWAAANRNDYMRRTLLFNLGKKISIFDFLSVPRRCVTILALD